MNEQAGGELPSHEELMRRRTAAAEAIHKRALEAVENSPVDADSTGVYEKAEAAGFRQAWGQDSEDASETPTEKVAG